VLYRSTVYPNCHSPGKRQSSLNRTCYKERAARDSLNAAKVHDRWDGPRMTHIIPRRLSDAHWYSGDAGYRWAETMTAFNWAVEADELLWVSTMVALITALLLSFARCSSLSANRQRKWRTYSLFRSYLRETTRRWKRIDKFFCFKRCCKSSVSACWFK